MSKNKKIALLSIILNLGALIVLLLIIYPLYNGIKQESEDLILQKTIQQQTIEKSNSQKQIEHQLKDYIENLEKIYNLFVSCETTIDSIEFLENMARDFNLSMKITPQSFGKGKEHSCTSINLDINLIGSFSDIAKFIEKLEYSCFPGANQENGYLIEINNLRLKNLSEKNLQLEKFKRFKIEDIDAHFLIKIAAK